MPAKYALIVEDVELKHEAEVLILENLGYEATVCRDSETAIKILRNTEKDYSLVMVDKEILEKPEDKIPQEWVGASLIFTIAREFRFVSHLVLFTSLSDPNVGDIQQVYKAGASALAAPPNTDKQTFIKALEMVTMGHQVLSPRFKVYGSQAMEPEAQCPLDAVEYYCARLIAEHRGKEGAAKKWGNGVSMNNIDDLLEDIYIVFLGFIPDFDKLSKDGKSFEIGKWYHDVAVKTYGAAFPIKYESKSVRRKKRLNL